MELYPHCPISLQDLQRDKFIYRAVVNVVISIWNVIKNTKYLPVK